MQGKDKASVTKMTATVTPKKAKELNAAEAAQRTNKEKK
jgi:hypothetical protein